MSRETLVFCLDVSRSLGDGPELKNMHEVARLAVSRKLFAFPKDEVGLVLAGTPQTSNLPFEDPTNEEYAHITVAHNPLPVMATGIKLLRTLERMPPLEERASGVDVWSALVSAIYVLGNRIKGRKKIKDDVHRVILITAGTEPLPMPDDDNLERVVMHCVDFDVRVSVLTIGIDVAAQTCAPATSEKQSTLEMLVALGARLGERLQCAHLSSALAELSAHRPPAAKPARSKFKGMLELPDLNIRVACFPKVVETKLAAPKAFSLVARERDSLVELVAAAPAAPETEAGMDEPPARETAAQLVARGINPWQIERDRTYTPVGDLARNVAPEETSRAFRYGQDYVPEQHTDAGAFKWSSGDKCLKVLGFVKQARLPEKDRLGGCDVLVADPDDARAAVAIAALVVALEETGCAMLARFIPRKNSAPRLSACWPRAEELPGGGVAYSLLMDNRPFADELRAATWPAADAASAPTDGQLAAAADLIDAMMVSASGPHAAEGAAAAPAAQYYDLDELPHPFAEHVQRVILQRALAPGSQLPDVAPDVAAMIAAPPALLERARAQLDAFASRLPTSAAAQEPGGVKRVRQLTIREEGGDEADGAQGAAKRAAVAGGGGDAPRGPVLLAGVASTDCRWPNGRVLSRADPVADLRAMLNDRGYDYTASAFEQMGALVQELAPVALEEEAQRLVLVCVEELRAECIAREQPEAYNATLRALRESCGSVGAKPLWARLSARAEALTLISSADTDESSVAPEEAAAFWAPARAAQALPEAQVVAEAGGDDDLE